MTDHAITDDDKIFHALSFVLDLTRWFILHKAIMILNGYRLKFWK
jgi:hypothetical protein